MGLERGFIPVEALQLLPPGKARPDIVSPIAWTPGSTPPELIMAAQQFGAQAPERPTLDDIFLAGDRFAAECYLTRTCALDCTGCSVPKSMRWAKETRQEPAAWMRGIHALREWGLRALKFIGGEVGTIPWLADVAGFAIEEGIHVSIFTDGVPFLDDPPKFEAVMKETNGEVLWMTSVDFVPPTEEMARRRGKEENTARRFKAQRGTRFIDMVKGAGGVVIGHMMVHQPNVAEIGDVYAEVSGRGGLFSVGTMQVNAHLYQGRHPDAYKQALTGDDEQAVIEQIEQLIAIEDTNVHHGHRTIANSRAHLATTATVGIQQNIGCSDSAIGPPSVFAVMPDGSLRGCPVIMTQPQIEACPGCAYAVFRDGDPRWAEYLGNNGYYQTPTDREDFPSLFYPHERNYNLRGILPWAK